MNIVKIIIALSVLTMVMMLSISMKMSAVKVIDTRFTKLLSNYVIATNMVVHAWYTDIHVHSNRVLKFRDLPSASLLYKGGYLCTFSCATSSSSTSENTAREVYTVAYPSMRYPL